MLDVFCLSFAQTYFTNLVWTAMLNRSLSTPHLQGSDVLNARYVDSRGYLHGHVTPDTMLLHRIISFLLQTWHPLWRRD